MQSMKTSTEIINRMMNSKEKIEDNLSIIDYLQPHYKWNLISMGFCDRMLMVMILSTSTKSEVKSIKEYLTKNYFFKHKNINVYYRCKSRKGHYITPEEFDKENYGVRNEMVQRLIGRNNIYVEN